jgi:hypothetical protein
MGHPHIYAKLCANVQVGAVADAFDRLITRGRSERADPPE